MDWYCNDPVTVNKYPDHLFYYIIGKEFTIKETSAPDYFLGGYFECVKYPKTNNKILTWGSNTYAKHVMEIFKTTFVFETSKQHFAMPPDYKPDLDTTEIFTYTNK